MKNIFLIIVSIFVKLFSTVSNVLNLLSINLVYLKEKSNIFCTFLNLRNFFIKKKIVNNVEIKIAISSWWDLHGINFFKDYAVKDIFFDKKFKKEIVFLEIGANTGIASLLIAKKFNKSTVYSIEFEPNSYLTLSQNIYLNNLSNIIPLCFGLAKKSDHKKFYYNLNYKSLKKYNTIQSGAGGHSITFDKNAHHKNYFFKSVFTNYDKLSKTLNLKTPSHVFIDAHGGEKEIISGMINTLTKKNMYKVYVDTEEHKNFKNLWVYKKLNKLGFKLTNYETSYFGTNSSSTSLIFKKNFKQKDFQI